MAHTKMALALSIIATSSPVSAARQDPTATPAAPSGTPDTRYCMRIEAITGSRLEQVKCWTRDEWAQRGVDVDSDWPREGVRTIG